MAPSPGQRPWWTHRRSWWELFLQFFAVALGVFMGTAVTSWREERAARETERRAVQGIANEVAFNRSALQQRRDYYAMVATEIRAVIAAKGSAAAYADLKTFRGFDQIPLRRSSLEVSMHSQAFGRLDYALAERIAAVYALQDWVLRGHDKWMDYIVQHTNNSLPLAELGVIMSDWAAMGDQLLAAYEDLQRDLPPGRPAEPR